MPLLLNAHDWVQTCQQNMHACRIRLVSCWIRQHIVLPGEAALRLQGVTDGWQSARDWVDAQGGINLEALVKQFGDAKIWATECSRCFTSLHILLALAGLACVTITSWHSHTLRA